MLFAAEKLVGPSVPWFYLNPLFILLGGIVVLMLVGSLAPQWPRHWYGVFSAATAAITLISTVLLWDNVTNEKPRAIFGDA
jgi:low affinity Fe/Cu permease